MIGAPRERAARSELSVSVLVVTWNSASTLDRCLEAIRRELPAGAELLVLDNRSSDASAAIAQKHGARVRIEATNVGFARGMNSLAAEARGDVLVLVNPDVFLHPGALAALVGSIEDAESRTIVGGLLVDESGVCEPTSARPLPTASALLRWLVTRRKSTWQVPRAAQEVRAVSGAFFAITRTFWQELGGFDECYLHSGEDLDLFWSASRAEGTVWFEPSASATHVGGASVRQAPLEIDALRISGAIRLVRKRQGRLAAALVRTGLLARSLAVLGLDALRIHRLPARRRTRALALLRLALRGERRGGVALPLEPEPPA